MKSSLATRMEEVAGDISRQLLKDISHSEELWKRIELAKVLNRKHWWEFWKPKYTWPDLEGVYEVKVRAGQSLQSNGRVTKVTGVPTYEPDHKIKGGRVVKGMPRSLKKLKEAQDKAPSEL